jgi:plastocyanin
MLAAAHGGTDTMTDWRIPVIGLVLAMAQVSSGTAVAQEAPQAAVDIVQYQFKPKELVVAPGTVVTWTNLDAVSHTVTIDDRSWDSDLFTTGEQFSMTFDAPGTYGYYCVPHGSPGSGMIGTVVVLGAEEVAPPEEPEMAPPSEEVPPEAPPEEPPAE